MSSRNTHLRTSSRRKTVLAQLFAFLFTMCVFTTFLSGPVAAASCSTVPGCTKGSTVANKAASVTVTAAINAFKYLVDEYITLIKDALTRLANQGSNNLDQFSKTQTNLLDSRLVTMTAGATGMARAAAAVEMMPSRTACRTASNGMRIENAVYSAARIDTYNVTQRNATDYAANAPGSPTERGAIQATQSTFLDTMKDFCDPAVMNPPAGVNCTLATDSEGQPMAFRYTQPYQAVFGVPNGTIPPDATNPENRAARLFVRMATEPVPTDPIRGPALTRNEGQAAFVRRQSDIATVNLARGAIDRMVDDRIGTTVAGGESVEYLRQRAWADASGLAKDAIDRAAQPTPSNMDDLAPLVGDINKIYLQIFNNFERLAAIKATHLARTVSEKPAGNSTVSGRSINN